VKGPRAAIYLDRFWNELSGGPEKKNRRKRPAATTPNCTRGRKLCTTPFRAVRRIQPGRPIDNKALLAQGGKITMPVFRRRRGENPSARPMGGLICASSPPMSPAASFPNSGHWIMEENPQATVIKLVAEFLAKMRRAFFVLRAFADGLPQS